MSALRSRTYRTAFDALVAQALDAVRDEEPQKLVRLDGTDVELHAFAVVDAIGRPTGNPGERLVDGEVLYSAAWIS